MKIAVIGCGFVGGTVADFLEEHTVKDGVEVIRIDPKIPDAPAIEDVTELDAAILCLNAPTDPDNTVDVKPTYDYVNQLNNKFSNIHIMVKSTMPMFADMDPSQPVEWPDNVVFNPEFLRANSAAEDFKNQQLFILGISPSVITHDEPANENIESKFWTNIFAPSLPNTEFIYTDIDTAVMVKYTHNAWLATKITFFHSLSRAMPGLSDYNKMTDILAKFPNIGPSHMKVPNAVGGLGYEGFCFPKDMKAFGSITNSNLIYDIIQENEKIKKKTDFPMALDSGVLPKLIPQEDFIICIGTSHTAGECDGGSVDSYATWVEKILGIKVLEIGYSGAGNIDLLALLTELSDWGFLNDRCKLVTLEPRITDSTTQNSMDSVIGRDKTIRYLREGTFQDSHLARTSLLKPHDTPRGSVPFPISKREGIITRIGPGNINNAETNVRSKINNYDNGKKMISWDAEPELKENFKSWSDSIKMNLVYNKDSLLSARDDLQLIQGMANIVKNAGIPFRWFMIDDRKAHIQTLRQTIEKSSSIFKDMLLTKSVQHLATNGDKRRPWYKFVDQELVCECSHFSAKGNEYIAKEFIAPAIKKTLNKVSESNK
jgi:hypothetical protein